MNQPDYLNSILVLSAAGTTFAKLLVDLARLGVPNAPSWLWPLLAALFGVGVVLLLMLANDVALTQQAVAQGILAGVLSAAGAVGITEVQKRVQ